MVKQTKLSIDFATTDLANARVRLFTDFPKAGDAKIVRVVIDPQTLGVMTLFAEGPLSKEQKMFASRRLG